MEPRGRTFGGAPVRRRWKNAIDDGSIMIVGNQQTSPSDRASGSVMGANQRSRRYWCSVGSNWRARALLLSGLRYENTI